MHEAYYFPDWYMVIQVDKHSTLEKRVIEVPSLASIEQMRSSLEVKEENVSDNKLKRSLTESKIPCPRTPFSDVN